MKFHLKTLTLASCFFPYRIKTEVVKWHSNIKMFNKPPLKHLKTEMRRQTHRTDVEFNISPQAQSFKCCTITCQIKAPHTSACLVLQKTCKITG